MAAAGMQTPVVRAVLRADFERLRRYALDYGGRRVYSAVIEPGLGAASEDIDFYAFRHILSSEGGGRFRI